MAWSSPRTWTTGEVMTAAYFNAQIRDALLTSGPGVVTAARQVAYATAANAMAASAAGSALSVLRMTAAATAVELMSQDDYLPWVSVLNCWGPYASATGTWSRTGYEFFSFYGAILNTGVQNDELMWPVVLAAGTWTFTILGSTDTDRAISTLKLDGTDSGTADWYSASLTKAAKSITGVSVASSGKKELKLVAATKNGSSSSYVLNLSAIICARTA